MHKQSGIANQLFYYFFKAHNVSICGTLPKIDFHLLNNKQPIFKVISFFIVLVSSTVGNKEISLFQSLPAVPRRWEWHIIQETAIDDNKLGLQESSSSLLTYNKVVGNTEGPTVCLLHDCLRKSSMLYILHGMGRLTIKRSKTRI